MGPRRPLLANSRSGTGRQALDLVDKTFGPLRAIRPWGSVAAGVVWIYWCRSCGAIGKRLGSHLTRGGGSVPPKYVPERTPCPRCRVDVAPRAKNCWARPTDTEIATAFVLDPRSETPTEDHYGIVELILSRMDRVDLDRVAALLREQYSVG